MTPVGPVDASRVPRYAGDGTFARLPRLADVPDADAVIWGLLFDIGEAVAAIESAATELSGTRRRVLTVGGDHAIALPLLRVQHQRYGPVAVLHFDAVTAWALGAGICLLAVDTTVYRGLLLAWTGGIDVSFLLAAAVSGLAYLAFTRRSPQPIPETTTPQRISAERAELTARVQNTYAR